MGNINRLKVVLIKRGKVVKWFFKQFGSNNIVGREV